MTDSLGLNLYLKLSKHATTPARLLQRWRLRLGKEDGTRRNERFGHAGLQRPVGPLAWFHSASIGEVVSILELVRLLGKWRPDLCFLMTTGTMGSAQILKSRLPPRTTHQFVPYDILPAVEKFLNHWQPSVGVWTESEFWPALIYESHRRDMPLLCVNARMSTKSFRRWRYLPGVANSLLNRFEKILVQDVESADRLQKLRLSNSRMEVVGSTKRGAGDLPFDEAAFEAFLRALGGRPLWLAASTHDGEEEAVAAAQVELSRDHENLLLLIVPRQPERGPEIAESLRRQGFQVSLRSEIGVPKLTDQIFIADTFGELGLWYRVSPVCFLGGSLIDVGGHNPFEPARHDTAIVHGPNVGNFAQEFKEIAELDAAILVEDKSHLVEAIALALQPENNARLTMSARALFENDQKVTDYVANIILRHLPNPESP